MADTGNGATLTQSGLTVAIKTIDVGGRTLPTVDVSLLSDTVVKLIAGDLLEQKPITITYEFDSTDADNLPTLNGASVSTTVTWPGQGGTAATLIGTVINTDLTLPTFENNASQVATIVMTPDGQTAMAFTVES